MNTSIPEELWHAALGPTAEEPPLPNHDFHHEGYDTRRPEGWPMENRGPLHGVPWFTWFARQLSQPGSSIETARQVGERAQRELLTGNMVAVAMHPETGRSYPIPVEDWQATGDTGRNLRWSGIHWAGAQEGIPCDVYLIDQTPWPAPPAEIRPSAAATKENMDSRILYGLARWKLGDRVDTHGAVEQVASGLRAMGIQVSNGTISDRLKRGREQYDPATDTTRKPK